MMHISRPIALALAFAVCCGWSTPQLSAQSPAAKSLPEVLTKAIANYTTLQSYADSGTVTVDTGGTVDKGRFTTYVRRASRDLYFDYQALTSLTVSTKFTIDMRDFRNVLWMFNGAMQTYQTPTPEPLQLVGTDSGAQVRALAGLSHSTHGAAIMITSLLYSQARLPSAILQIEEASVAGTEPIEGRPCHKVVGTAAAYYPNGQRTGVRPVTVWIDTETQLVRRVLEDTPEGYGDGKATLRITFDYQPRANPVLDDSKFKFTPPAK
jgi:outer membrane lipoprotein-sorting protein